MPTDNPRLVAYPNRALYERLKKFQKTKGLKTLSKAVIIALEDYFRQVDSAKKPGDEEIQLIKREVAQLREQLEQVEDWREQLEQIHQKIARLEQ